MESKQYFCDIQKMDTFIKPLLKTFNKNKPEHVQQLKANIYGVLEALPGE